MASVTPTSRFCVRTVCRPIDFGEDIDIVEYGAGAGVFAEYLLKHMTPDSTLTMFETNEYLFQKLKEIRDPRVTLFNESVEHVGRMLEEDRKGAIDYIISGIPFSFLDKQVKLSILEQSKAVLSENGAFLAYQTSGHLTDPLQKVFGNAETEWEWRNIPPMTVYRAYKSPQQQSRPSHLKAEQDDG